MLFAVKNRLAATLVVLGIFLAAAFTASFAWELEWRLDFRPPLLLYLAAGAATLAASDILLQWAFTRALGERYWRRYRTLVEFFAPQKAAAIVAGSLLAGGEELIFRGLLLEGLRVRAGLPAVLAVWYSALVFGICHFIPRRLLWPFTFWAVWEGVLLGWVYVASGSLCIVVVLHVLHDLAGFSLFAYQRRTGWLTGT